MRAVWANSAIVARTFKESLRGLQDTVRVRIALERSEVRILRPIPRTSIRRVEEGRADSNYLRACLSIWHVHESCSWPAPGAEIPMPSKKVHGYRCQKSDGARTHICTCARANMQRNQEQPTRVRPCTGILRVVCAGAAAAPGRAHWRLLQL